jgi:membrane protein implicated in regulation of membrane protease activity
MEAWVVWFIVAVAFVVGEMLTLSFFLAPFAAGALLAAVADLVGLGSAPQVAAFIVGSLLALTVVRPIARAHRRSQVKLRTGTAALVGRRAVVLERIANAEGLGCVKIDGEVWTARAYLDDEIIEPGTQVEVLEIRGATAMVAE